jgi:hypothetical protein
LTSIVIALGITRILNGIGRIVQLRGQIRFSWAHLLWAVNGLLYLLLNWWILFRWHAALHWTFFRFLFVLISPVVGFLMAVLLFPEPLEAGADLRAHFRHNHRSFFGLAALLPLVDAADTMMKGWDHFLAQGPQYIVTMALIFVLSLVAAAVKKERFHAAFGIFFLVYILVFISINLRVLS